MEIWAHVNAIYTTPATQKYYPNQRKTLFGSPVSLREEGLQVTKPKTQKWPTLSSRFTVPFLTLHVSPNIYSHKSWKADVPGTYGLKTGLCEVFSGLLVITTWHILLWLVCDVWHRTIDFRLSLLHLFNLFCVLEYSSLLCDINSTVERCYLHLWWYYLKIFLNFF